MATSTISFNGGKPLELQELNQETESIEYWSALAVRPDLGWRHIDEQGHKHRWKQDEGQDGPWRVTKSTARSEHVPCDDSCGNWDCDGYDTTVYECSKCGERLKPGWLPDNGLKSMPGMTTITAVVGARTRDLPGFRDRTSFVVTMNGKETMRGTAEVVDLTDKDGRGKARVNLVPSR